MKCFMDLHSSMDRFEEKKEEPHPPVIENLHSSMDRFEGLICIYNYILNVIYIPVWIDLKDCC